MRFPNRGTSKLVIVAPSDYAHQTLENLPAVAKCANRLRDILTSADAGGFLLEHCLLSDGDLEPKELIGKIQPVASTAEDVLAVWIIGHGLIDVDSRKLHFALKGTDPGNLYYSALPFEALRKIITASPAAIKILMVDCCFSGKAITEMALGGPGEIQAIVSAEVAVEGTLIVTACSGREIALAPPEDEYTAFTGAVLEVLQEQTPPPMSELISRVCRVLKGRGYPVPHHAASHNAADLRLVRPYERACADAGPLAAQFTVIQHELLGSGSADCQRTGGGGLAQAGAHQVAGEAEFDVSDQVEREARLRQLLADADAASREGNDDKPEPVIAKLCKIITDMIPLGGPGHLSTLAARDLQVIWLSRAGNNVDAVHLCIRILKARAALHGPEHPAVLTSRHNLAHLTGLAGDMAAAISQFTALVDDRRRIQGDRHADTLLSLDGLAYWKASNGETCDAIAMYQDLLGEDDWQSGPHNERTLWFLERLAWAKGLSGDPAGARDAYADLARRRASRDGAESLSACKSAKLSEYWAARVQSDS